MNFATHDSLRSCLDQKRSTQPRGHLGQTLGPAPIFRGEITLAIRREVPSVPHGPDQRVERRYEDSFNRRKVPSAPVPLV